MADDQVIRREFQAELTPVGDGRTIDMRIVPYKVKARVRDAHGPEYEEEWLPGVFDKQIKAANRVFVNVEHEKGFSGVVGKGAEFREAKDGFHGSVRIDEGPAGDKALRFVNEGALTGVSLEAIPLEWRHSPDGVVQRVKARLINIALCRFPAFSGAEVLAVREVATPEEPEPEPPAPEPEPEPSDPAYVDATLERIGYEPLMLRATTDRPWDGSAARFEDDEYERACLVCRPGDESAKTRCSLPVLEPNGDLNINGMHAAASRLNQTGLSPELKGRAARKLVRYYRQAGEEAPPALVALASR